MEHLIPSASPLSLIQSPAHDAFADASPLPASGCDASPPPSRERASSLRGGPALTVSPLGRKQSVSAPVATVAAAAAPASQRDGRKLLSQRDQDVPVVIEEGKEEGDDGDHDDADPLEHSGGVVTFSVPPPTAGSVPVVRAPSRGSSSHAHFPQQQRRPTSAQQHHQAQASAAAAAVAATPGGGGGRGGGGGGGGTAKRPPPPKTPVSAALRPYSAVSIGLEAASPTEPSYVQGTRNILVSPDCGPAGGLSASPYPALPSGRRSETPVLPGGHGGASASALAAARSLQMTPDAPTATRGGHAMMPLGMSPPGPAPAPPRVSLQHQQQLLPPYIGGAGGSSRPRGGSNLAGLPEEDEFPVPAASVSGATRDARGAAVPVLQRTPQRQRSPPQALPSGPTVSTPQPSNSRAAAPGAVGVAPVATGPAGGLVVTPGQKTWSHVTAGGRSAAASALAAAQQQQPAAAVGLVDARSHGREADAPTSAAVSLATSTAPGPASVAARAAAAAPGPASVALTRAAAAAPGLGNGQFTSSSAAAPASSGVAGPGAPATARSRATSVAAATEASAIERAAPVTNSRDTARHAEGDTVVSGQREAPSIAARSTPKPASSRSLRGGGWENAAAASTSFLSPASQFTAASTPHSSTAHVLRPPHTAGEAVPHTLGYAAAAAGWTPASDSVDAGASVEEALPAVGAAATQPDRGARPAPPGGGARVSGGGPVEPASVPAAETTLPLPMPAPPAEPQPELAAGDAAAQIQRQQQCIVMQQQVILQQQQLIAAAAAARASPAFDGGAFFLPQFAPGYGQQIPPVSAPQFYVSAPQFYVQQQQQLQQQVQQQPQPQMLSPQPQPAQPFPFGMPGIAYSAPYGPHAVPGFDPSSPVVQMMMQAHLQLQQQQQQQQHQQLHHQQQQMQQQLHQQHQQQLHYYHQLQHAQIHQQQLPPGGMLPTKAPDPRAPAWVAGAASSHIPSSHGASAPPAASAVSVSGPVEVRAPPELLSGPSAVSSEQPASAAPPIRSEAVASVVSGDGRSVKPKGRASLQTAPSAHPPMPMPSDAVPAQSIPRTGGTIAVAAPSPPPALTSAAAKALLESVEQARKAGDICRAADLLQRYVCIGSDGRPHGSAAVPPTVWLAAIRVAEDEQRPPGVLHSLAAEALARWPGEEAVMVKAAATAAALPGAAAISALSSLFAMWLDAAGLAAGSARRGGTAAVVTITPSFPRRPLLDAVDSLARLGSSTALSSLLHCLLPVPLPVAAGASPASPAVSAATSTGPLLSDALVLEERWSGEPGAAAVAMTARATAALPSYSPFWTSLLRVGTRAALERGCAVVAAAAAELQQLVSCECPGPPETSLAPLGPVYAVARGQPWRLPADVSTPQAGAALAASVRVLATAVPEIETAVALLGCHFGPILGAPTAAERLSLLHPHHAPPPHPRSLLDVCFPESVGGAAASSVQPDLVPRLCVEAASLLVPPALALAGIAGQIALLEAAVAGSGGSQAGARDALRACARALRLLGALVTAAVQRSAAASRWKISAHAARCFLGAACAWSRCAAAERTLALGASAHIAAEQACATALAEALACLRDAASEASASALPAVLVDAGRACELAGAIAADGGGGKALASAFPLACSTALARAAYSAALLRVSTGGEDVYASRLGVDTHGALAAYEPGSVVAGDRDAGGGTAQAPLPAHLRCLSVALGRLRAASIPVPSAAACSAGQVASAVHAAAPQQQQQRGVKEQQQSQRPGAVEPRSVRSASTDWRVWTAAIHFEARCGALGGALKLGALLTAPAPAPEAGGCTTAPPPPLRASGRLWALAVQLLRHAEGGHAEAAAGAASRRSRATSSSSRALLESGLAAFARSGELHVEAARDALADATAVLAEARIEPPAGGPRSDGAGTGSRARALGACDVAASHLSLAAQCTQQFGDVYVESLRLHRIVTMARVAGPACATAAVAADGSLATAAAPPSSRTPLPTESVDAGSSAHVPSPAATLALAVSRAPNYGPACIAVRLWPMHDGLAPPLQDAARAALLLQQQPAAGTVARSDPASLSPAAPAPPLVALPGGCQFCLPGMTAGEGSSGTTLLYALFGGDPVP